MQVLVCFGPSGAFGAVYKDTIQNVPDDQLGLHFLDEVLGKIAPVGGTGVGKMTNSNKEVIYSIDKNTICFYILVCVCV